MSPQLRLLPWRTHSCVPRRDSSRRVFARQSPASAGVPTRHARVRAPRLAWAFLVLLALPLSAAVTGTVINRTTGAPQAAATVTLYKFGQGGMEPVTETKTGAQGQFTINQNPAGPGPAMLRVEIDNVTYNHMLPPGTPTTGITLDVFNATRQPQGVKISKHMLLFQPSSGGPMTVNETFFMGHFPNFPVMPGVLIIEALAQTAGILVLRSIPDRDSKLVFLVSVDYARFRKPVVPGDQLRLELKMMRRKGTVVKMAGRATVEGVLVAEAEVMCKLEDRV